MLRHGVAMEVLEQHHDLEEARALLGHSRIDTTQVYAIIRQAPVTLSVAFGAAVIWLLIAIPIGVLAATRPKSLADRGATIFALAGISLPSFVLGMIVFNVLFFAGRDARRVSEAAGAAREADLEAATA